VKFISGGVKFMETDLTTTLFTIFNLILLCGIIYLVVKFFKSVSNLKKENDVINKKLDKVLQLLDNTKID
jgi:flagellar biogenesis protein FliO